MKKINSFQEYQEQYSKSVENPEKFWEGIANTFTWDKKWDSVLDWNFEDPSINWFKGARLNITENCIDRHLPEKANQTAIIWESNEIEGEHKRVTYSELSVQVNKTANGLKELGVKKGDRVCIYMPMSLELSYTVLACARIGAIHSVVFAGFSAKSLSDRINDAKCELLVTADGFYRGKKYIDLKDIADQAVVSSPSIQKVLVLKHSGKKINWNQNQDLWYHELVNHQSSDCKPEMVDAEDELFILYTSGSTGSPKGVVHSTAGYMVYAEYSFRNVFQYNDGDMYWCTADIGWITGHSYIIYGPLLAGATTIMFEGTPTYPDAGRFWDVVDKYKVNIFYTAPTAIRALQAHGLDYVNKYDLSSLKVLGSVGEPINEEAWEWYHKHIGKGKCALVDTWWQTETGGIMISPLAGLTKEKPTFATYPLPGIQPILVNPDGEEIVGNGVEGNLCVKFPWPSMIRTTWGDHDRCKQVYFSTYDNLYFTGDGCKRDEDGMYRITGRVDDVINVSGHRIGTAEVEDGINSFEGVVESAVVGYPHDIKGQGIYAYIICQDQINDQAIFAKAVRDHITKEIGALAKPDKIQVVSGLPKTRSGKIMRRILRKVAEGVTDNLGDTSTLLDPSVVKEIIDSSELVS